MRCVNVEVAVLGSPSLIVRTLSVDGVKAVFKEERSCVKVEVADLGPRR